MKSNLKPREKERDLHCANLSCSKEEQYKKCYPQPPEEKRKQNKKVGVGVGGGVGGGGACHCLHSDKTVLSDCYTVVPPFVERKPVASGEEGGIADSEIKVFQI